MKRVRQHVLTAAMNIGEHVIYNGRLYVLRGFDPMGVTDRTADLEDVETGAHVDAPFAEVQPAPVAEPPAGEVWPGDP